MSGRVSKRMKGREAIEKLLRYGVSTFDLNSILRDAPSGEWTAGAYERLIDAQIAEQQKAQA